MTMTFDISSMLNPTTYNHPVGTIVLIETHISYVILTGDFAYKIKKAVDFGFLDFSTVSKRLENCENELRLNRRLAPEIYLDVVAITGTTDKPVMGGDGTAIEYAVKMKQFAQSAQLDNMLAAGELHTDHIDAVARMIADFHRSTAVADETVGYGSSNAVYQPVKENFAQIRKQDYAHVFDTVLDRLQHWSEQSYERLEAVFDQRKHDGFIRECHGDMHLRNLVWLDGSTASGPRAFDCIEFNAQLRWIDVISEVAFLVMDLQSRQQALLANHCLNTYLEVTGDYAALPLLRFYLCYRALVRTKVSVLRSQQAGIEADEKKLLDDEFASYLNLAVGYTKLSPAKLIIMRGPSASGKSTLSQQLVDHLGLIRIRSDVERKRMFNIRPDSHHKNGAALYSKKTSFKVYRKLLDLSAMLIDAGYSVIVDAAFLAEDQRSPFQQLAESCGISYHILEITAASDVLRRRIIERKNDVSDADVAILEQQLANWQPLHETETASAILIDTGKPLDMKGLLAHIEGR